MDLSFLAKYRVKVPIVGTSKASVYNESQILPVGFRPSAKDILLGRGKAFNNHVGNRRFRVAIAMNLRPYVESSTKTEKSLCVQRILQAIRTASPTGGFVKKDSKTGSWITVTDTEACQKIGHALRDAWSGALSNTNVINSDSRTPAQEAENFEARIQRAQYICVMSAVRPVVKASAKKFETCGASAQGIVLSTKSKVCFCAAAAKGHDENSTHLLCACCQVSSSKTSHGGPTNASSPADASDYYIEARNSKKSSRWRSRRHHNSQVKCLQAI
jgi:hypothetical protein